MAWLTFGDTDAGTKLKLYPFSLVLLRLKVKPCMDSCLANMWMIHKISSRCHQIFVIGGLGMFYSWFARF